MLTREKVDGFRDPYDELLELADVCKEHHERDEAGQDRDGEQHDSHQLLLRAALLQTVSWNHDVCQAQASTTPNARHPRVMSTQLVRRHG